MARVDDRDALVDGVVRQVFGGDRIDTLGIADEDRRRVTGVGREDRRRRDVDAVDHGEAVENGARLADEHRVEAVAVDVEHDRAEVLDRIEHRRVVQRTATGRLARTAGHRIDRAVVRQRR